MDEFVAENELEQNPLDNAKTRLKIFEEVEKARKTLITSDDAQLFIENLAEDEDGDAVDLATAILKATFDQSVQEISNLFNQFLRETVTMYG